MSFGGPCRFAAGTPSSRTLVTRALNKFTQAANYLLRLFLLHISNIPFIREKGREGGKREREFRLQRYVARNDKYLYVFQVDATCWNADGKRSFLSKI